MSNPDAAADSERFARGRIERLRRTLADFEHVVWLLVLASLTLDVYLTFRGLQSGLAEYNPIMSYAIATFGFPVLGLTKVVVLGFAGFFRAARPDVGVLIPLAIAVPWLLTVAVNLFMLGPSL